MDIDLSWLNNNFQRSLAKYARKSSAHQVRRLEKKRKYATLAVFLIQTYKDRIDQLVATLDKLVRKIGNRAQKQFEKSLRGKHQAMRNSITTMRSLASVILDDDISDNQIREHIYARIPKELWRPTVKLILQDPFALLVKGRF